MKHPFINRRPVLKYSEKSPTNDQNTIQPNSPKNPELRKSSFVKIDGNLQHFFEEYSSFAQEAMRQGDRVLAESYYQYAEHALRLKNQLEKTSVDY